jgi:Tetratricopeptide repeat/Putative S-adenosyl-L-methionine-dependent methyltransferase
VIVEEPVRLSASRIWQGMKDFYASVGIDAWSENVPFYETSNPYIAESYTNLIVRFIQDCINAGRHNQEEPFYILELGAGSGTFAFYTLKHLSKLKRLLGLANTSIVYVMTDVSQKHIDYWSNHPAFQPYLQEGLLDFAVFDVQLDREIVLQRSARTIAASGDVHQTNPMIAIANYFFDSLPQDIFRITNGETQLGLAKVMSRSEDYDNHDSLKLSEIEVEFSYETSTPPFYSNARFSETLDKCRARLNDHYLLFPIGALCSIENLIEISANQLCLIVSDNGFSHQFEYHQRSQPFINPTNDWFSMRVNFDAIGCFFESIGGDALHQSAEYALQMSVFLAGFRLNQVPETQYAMDVFVNSRSHGLLFSLNEELEDTNGFFPIDLLLPFLMATRWDPMVFHNNVGAIIEQIRAKSAQLSDLSSLVLAIEEIAGNFYYVPSQPDIFYDISEFLQEVGEYQRALEYYERSIALFGLTETKLCNMGLCYYLLGEHMLAIASFQEAVSLNPKNITARGWIAQIEYEAKT